MKFSPGIKDPVNASIFHYDLKNHSLINAVTVDFFFFLDKVLFITAEVHMNWWINWCYVRELYCKEYIEKLKNILISSQQLTFHSWSVSPLQSEKTDIKLQMFLCVIMAPSWQQEAGITAAVLTAMPWMALQHSNFLTNGPKLKSTLESGSKQTGALCTTEKLEHVHQTTIYFQLRFCNNVCPLY